MSKNMKKIVSMVAAIAIIATVGLGAFSYFTDYASKDVSAEAGTLSITLTNVTEDLTDGLDILNPGDSNPVEFTITNTGSKSADIRAVVTIDSSVAMTDGAYEYTLGNAGVAPVASNENKTLTYTIDLDTLQGSKETEATDGVAGPKDYAYTLDFAKAAGNKFQDSDVEVTIEIYAKQHRNTTESDWTLEAIIADDLTTADHLAQ